jgi:hypothetical protein
VLQKLYLHRIKVKHVQVPHYRSRGVDTDEFSTDMSTSGYFLVETKHNNKTFENKAVRRKFRPNKNEVSEEFRMSHTETIKTGVALLRWRDLGD